MQKDNDEIITLLKRVSMFAEAPAETLAEITTLLEPLELRGEETVFQQGDLGDSLYLIAAGRVRVHHEDKDLDELGRGDIFGEMALLDTEPRSASVTTLEKATLFRLEQRAFNSFLLANPEIARGIIRTLNQRLRARMRDLSDLQSAMGKLYQLSAKAERLSRELRDASEVQASFLPQTLPQLPGWAFAAGWQPAKEVSGDFYDVVPLEQCLGIVIADVADKGMPAALFMALTRSTIRSSVSAASTPAKSITQANRLLCKDASQGMFVTLFYAQLEPESSHISYVNAGHNPPLVLDSVGGTFSELGRTGLFLGWDETATYETGTAFLEPGDVLLLYTDGVTEATDPHGETFGEARLKHCLLKHQRASPEEILQRLQDDLRAFIGGAEPFDDITLMIVKRL